MIHNGENVQQWETHEELDEWEKENGETYPKHLPLLKGFHRGFQVQGSIGRGCRFDAPTLLIGENGSKLPVNDKFEYKSGLDSHVSGQGVMSGGSVHKKNKNNESENTNENQDD